MGTRLGLNGLPTFAYGGVSGGREPVQERVLMALNDIKHSGLQNFLATSGSVGDMENAYLQSLTGLTGSTRDLWQAYWASLGITSQSYNDAAYEWLGGLGFSGTLVERWRGYWQAGLLIQEALVDLNGDNITTTAGAVTEWANAGTGGASYDLDVVVGTGANLKKHPSGTMLHYGVSAAYTSAPDAVMPTTDIGFLVWVEPDDWTPATAQVIFAQWGGTASDNAVKLFLGTGGNLGFTTSDDGTEASAVSSASTVAVGGTDGEGKWVALTWDQSASQLKFYTSDLGRFVDLDTVIADLLGNQLGTTVTHTDAGIAQVNQALVWGAEDDGGTGLPFAGSIGRGYIFNTADLTATESILHEIDPRDYTSGSTFTSGSDTWALQGDVFIQNTGRDVVHTIGAAGLETTAGQTISAPMTWFAVARASDAAPSATMTLNGGRSLGTAQPYVYTDNADADQFKLDAGSPIDGNLAFDTDWHVFTVQHNADATTKFAVSGVGSVTGNAGAEDWDFGTILNGPGGSSGWIGACARLLVFNRALTDAEAAALETHLKAYAGIAA